MATTRTAEAGADIEIKGRAVTSVVEGAARLAPAYRDRALALLAGHGIPEPRVERWYDATGFQGAVTELAESVGPATTGRAGMAMVDLLEWSDGVDSVPAALAELDALYRRLHRGGDVGSVAVEETGERTAVVTCRTPYPGAFDRGLLRGIVYEFSDGVPLVSDRTASGGDTGTRTYELTW